MNLGAARCVENRSAMMFRGSPTLVKESSIMASEKKRRKLSSLDRKRKHPVNPQRPKDGDRRHRGADLARLEQQRKEAARQWNLDVGWTDASEEPK
jgi:hypothetical protein